MKAEELGAVGKAVDLVDFESWEMGIDLPF